MIDAIKQQLSDTCKPPLMDVFGAAEFAALRERPPARMPTAYVISLLDRAEPNDLAAGAVRQKLDEQIAIVLAISSTGKPLGDTDLVQQLRNQVRGALLGFDPGNGYSALEYRRGGLIDLIDGIVWWQLDFSTEFHIRKVS